MNINTRDRYAGLFFTLPAVLYMLVFVGYPILSNIILSLQDVTVRTINTNPKPFVGFKNYIEVFQDPVLLVSLKNTMIFTVGSILFQFIIGFLLALFFNSDFRISKPVRGLLMIPWMIPITITALMFKFMFTSNVGIINGVLKMMNLKPVEWLLHGDTALFSLIAANVWIGIPFNMILLTTGLATIPKELYESSSIDGAGKIKSFIHITLPLLKPTIETILVLGFIYTFKVFDLVYVMTGGGPVNATQMMSTYSYKASFTLFKYSYGATVANILFVILAIVGFIYIRISNTEKEPL